ncbi:MAG: hypothetical protein ACSLEL_00600 [Candidatus Malihini olakiniferum]
MIVNDYRQADGVGNAIVLENRKDGIVPTMSIAQNITLAAFDRFFGLFFAE